MVQAAASRLSASDPPRWQPWAWCNLGRNPFGELTRDERVQVAVVDIESIVDGVRSPKTAVQLIGDAGRGKTTRLLVLHQHLADSSYVYLPQDQPCPSIPHGNPLLIDEAQRLPRRVRRCILESGAPLVLATHRDLTRPLRRAGYHLQTVQIGNSGDASLVCQLANRRIESCRLADGPIPRLSSADAAWMVSRFGSDIRSMEAYLYDQVQKQAFSNGEMRFIDRAG